MADTKLSTAEALPLFLSGDLVSAQDLAARVEVAGKFILTEEELMDPASWPRQEGLPVSEVEGADRLFFSPVAVFAFMEEWLRLDPEEEAELERERLEEEREEQERLAKIKWDLEHPRPKVVVGAMESTCEAALRQIEAGIRHQNEKVRRAAMGNAQFLQRGAGKILAGQPWE